MLDYQKILKQAFAILRAHKFLWALGLFLVWGATFNFSSYISNQTQQSLLSYVKIFYGDHRGLAIGLGIVSLVFLIWLIIFCFRAKAAIILGTSRIIEKKDLARNSFVMLLKDSGRYQFRLFGIWFTTMFLLILGFSILAGPVAYLSSIHYDSRAAILGVMAVIIFVPLAYFAVTVNNLAPIFIVSYNHKFSDAITHSFNLARKLWPSWLAFSVVLGILTAVVGVITLSTWDLGVEIFGKIFYNDGGFHLTFGSGSAVAIAVLVFLMIQGAIASYQQIAWVLAFNDLVKPIRTEEEEIVPVPEVI